MVFAVSEHMGHGEAMPQQGIAQNAAANAEKPEQDQADMEAATIRTLPDKKVVVASDSHKCLDQMNVKKLTRAQRSKLVEQVLKVGIFSASCPQSLVKLMTWSSNHTSYRVWLLACLLQC